MMYRVVNYLIFIPADSILVPTISPKGNNKSFLVPHARTTIYHQTSFVSNNIRILKKNTSIWSSQRSIPGLLQNQDASHYSQTIDTGVLFLIAL
jgi:hypothetical protein